MQEVRFLKARSTVGWADEGKIDCDASSRPSRAPRNEPPSPSSLSCPLSRISHLYIQRCLVVNILNIDTTGSCCSEIHLWHVPLSSISCNCNLIQVSCDLHSHYLESRVNILEPKSLNLLEQTVCVALWSLLIIEANQMSFASAILPMYRRDNRLC